MKKVSLVIFMLFVVFIVSSSEAQAANWTQRWQQSETEIWNGQQVGPFDQMAIWAVDGTVTVFQDPALSNYSAVGWTAYNESNKSARAFTLTPMTYVQFDMNYATEFGVADFTYMCSYQGQVRQRQLITYNSSSGWSYPAFTGTDTEWHALGGGEPVPVPEPATILTFGSFAVLLLGKILPNKNK